MRPRDETLSTLRALASMASNVARDRLLGEQALLNPLFVSWEINSACNLRCPYCYLHDRSYRFDDRGLSFRRMKPVFRRIKNVTEDVMLLGGEPYIHPAWDVIVDHCTDELGLRVRCITNGTRLQNHMRTTGKLKLLSVSFDYQRAFSYPKQMIDMQRQLAAVASAFPRLRILIILVLCAYDDTGWVVERIHELTERGYGVFVNVDRNYPRQPLDSAIVRALRRAKRRTGRVHMTDRTLDWLADIRRPPPFCNPTLLPLLDPRARLIYPCCYYNEQNAGSLLDMDYATLLHRAAARYGRYPFEKCKGCTTTAYLDATVSVRKPVEGIRHYHTLYNR